jgi:glucose-6-phosphate dehydrogenase assembly protein OpcA
MDRTRPDIKEVRDRIASLKKRLADDQAGLTWPRLTPWQIHDRNQQIAEDQRILALHEIRVD